MRIQVRATGLNFRDVMLSLGIYPDGPTTIGGEFAGIVTELGSAVTGYAPGDRVMGISGDGIGSTVIAHSDLTTGIPDGWGFAQASGVPVVFLTAYYALYELVELERGNRILIHAGTGGVGMAAIQLSIHLGLEVFATASRAKWNVLRRMGLDDDHIADSRTLDFADKIARNTGGAGVDVVLNCLSGEFIDASLRILATGGTFLELGKADIRDAHSLAAGYPGITYRPFDMAEPELPHIRRMLADLMRMFERGDISPLPVNPWDVRLIAPALRHFSQARHIGKNVLTLPAVVDSGGTVLITGGTGALGRAVAKHAVQTLGIQNLILTNRHGNTTPQTQALLDELSTTGANVRIVACDVSDREALTHLLTTIPTHQPL
ncbi:MDR/SDR family oxidoreductase, partial [Nocardia sp. NPDC005978]|uniref:MDR/SDR family oxidoreductase n=1 Tax=Nocardia sp. NPDC005978 TaxID=3156725 RepID=UPI0033B32096